MSNLVFVDIETSGLDPYDEALLELGIVIYDPINDQVVDQEMWVFQADSDFWRDRSVEVVRQMHDANGLWEECKNSKLFPSPAEKEIAKWLSDYLPIKQAMCGNSVHFDRSWLEVWMPTVAAMFSHRNIDVSTLNELAKQGILFDSPAPKGGAHRALEDCHDSIRQLNYYRYTANHVGQAAQSL